jgi:hypothetical protein
MADALLILDNVHERKRGAEKAIASKKCVAHITAEKGIMPL